MVVDLKRFGLAARSVQREHQLPTKALAERLLLHEYLELAHKLGMRTGLQLRVDSLLQRRHA
jgi:hypothetical protein